MATVAVAFIGGIFSVITVLLQLRQRGKVNEVHAQVKNSHSTNLREDMDRIHHTIKSMQGQITGLVRALEKERKTRLDSDKHIKTLIRGGKVEDNGTA